MVIFRSALFGLVQVLSTLLFGSVCLFFWPFSFSVRHQFITIWVRINLWCLAKICCTEYQVEGRENIPKAAGVILSKHESAWETLALQVIFQPQVWVLKRELLWVPFLGWGLVILNPIPIDRSSGHRALGQIVRHGKERLQSGLQVIVFPEGTRVSPGEKKRYQSGGALLAKRAGCHVLPVVHNAADFWGRHSFIKKPGKIRVVIGPPIESENRSVAEINALAERWIEDTMKRIRVS